MCVCVCVCVYVCMCVCVYVYVCIYIYIYFFLINLHPVKNAKYAHLNRILPLKMILNAIIRCEKHFHNEI